MTESLASKQVPTFAVVGRVNKGKSSVIASLIENDRVKISPRPGTTTECVEYEVEVDGKVLFVVVDTPGFEDAPRALHWMKSQEENAADRGRVVRSFVEHFTDSEDFIEERRLLRPILDGAAVLYVVSGDEPYRANYESEMEILRWAGQPTMALINRSATGAYVDEWRRALDQFFKLVRLFDAHVVTADDRRALLRAFQTLAPNWETPLEQALKAMDLELSRRRFEVAGIVAKLLADSLSFSLSVAIEDNKPLSLEQPRIEKRFHDELRKLEQHAHGDIAEVYLHRFNDWNGNLSELEDDSDSDLFAEETWDVMGLSPAQQVAAATVAGATVGGGIDAAVGGASFLTGTVIGGLSGLGLGLYGLGRRFASASPLEKAKGFLGVFTTDGSRRIRVGPHPSINFPFVLLGRAISHYDRVRSWAHAVANPPAPKASGEALSFLDDDDRKKLASVFRDIRKRHRNVSPEYAQTLQRQLHELFQRRIRHEAARVKAES